jgi:hypothetical protein
VKVIVEVPQEILDANRPKSTETQYAIEVPIQLWSWKYTVRVRYVAVLYGCSSGHRFRRYRADPLATTPKGAFLSTGADNGAVPTFGREHAPLIMPCPTCGGEAKALTVGYRWVRDRVGEHCRGCQARLDRKSKSATHQPNCPYEEIGDRT